MGKEYVSSSIAISLLALPSVLLASSSAKARLPSNVCVLLVKLLRPKACNRVLNKSRLVKLVSKFIRVRLPKSVTSSTSSPKIFSPDTIPVSPKTTSPFSFVVVENWFASNCAVPASRASTRPRRVASSTENSACSRCRVARSSFLTLSDVAAAISSFTRSKQAFNPPANSYRVKARSPRKVPSGYPAMQP